MITQSLINIAYNLVNFIVNQFPYSQGFSPQVSDAIGTLTGYTSSMMSIFSPLLPFTTMAYALGLIFSVEISILSFKGFRWVFSHVPFIGGKSA